MTRDEQLRTAHHIDLISEHLLKILDPLEKEDQTTRAGASCRMVKSALYCLLEASQVLLIEATGAVPAPAPPRETEPKGIH